MVWRALMRRDSRTLFLEHKHSGLFFIFKRLQYYTLSIKLTVLMLFTYVFRFTRKKDHKNIYLPLILSFY